MDGALPHRRAPRERDDVLLRGDGLTARREVIVIGAGQAGLAIGRSATAACRAGDQIAEELAASGEVHLSIGSRETQLPQRLLGRDLFMYLEALGLMRKSVETRLGARLRGRETLIGSSPRSMRRRGVRIHPRAVDAAGAEVTFSDGERLSVDAVRWATGFEVDPRGSTPDLR